MVAAFSKVTLWSLYGLDRSQKEIRLSAEILTIWASRDLNPDPCGLDPKSSASAIPPLAQSRLLVGKDIKEYHAGVLEDRQS